MIGITLHNHELLEHHAAGAVSYLKHVTHKKNPCLLFNFLLYTYFKLLISFFKFKSAEMQQKSEPNLGALSKCIPYDISFFTGLHFHQ
jgi:hypothetical protein